MYKAYILNPEKDVHDGDTLLDVHIKILDSLGHKGNDLCIWPNIHIQEDGVYIVESVRLYGIDTAEMHPHHRDGEGNLRTEASLEAEKELARKARDEVYALLQKEDFKFWVTEPLNGKYAGRVVAKVLVGDSQAPIDVSAHLIDKGLAHPYFGHTKEPWD